MFVFYPFITQLLFRLTMWWMMLHPQMLKIKQMSDAKRVSSVHSHSPIHLFRVMFKTDTFLLKYFWNILNLVKFLQHFLKSFLHYYIPHCQEVFCSSKMNWKRKLEKTFSKIFFVVWFGLEFVNYWYLCDASSMYRARWYSLMIFLMS